MDRCRPQRLASRERGSSARQLRRWQLFCADGYEVSIQASSGHYCCPREDRAWPYSRFELGFPTAADEELKTCAEDPETLTATVYGFVPVSNILMVIAKHGGPSITAFHPSKACHMTPLETAGRALFGSTPGRVAMAKAFSPDVNERTVRRWHAGDSNVPSGIWPELKELLGKHAAECVRLCKHLGD